MEQYECKQCKMKFEAGDSCDCSCSGGETKCPQCGSTDVKKTEEFDKIFDSLKNLDFSGG